MNNKLIISCLFTFEVFTSSYAKERHNIILIMTDQQSHNMMSYAGNKWLSTPNIDQIAKNGYMFYNAYCANPVSMASRFSLLTGHYASEVGVKENTSAFDNKKVQEIIKNSIGNLFKKAGYETLYSGKTHLYGTKDVSEYGFKLNNLNPYDGPAIYAEEILPKLGKEKPFFLFLSFMNPHDICYKAGMDKRFPYDLPKDKTLETIKLLKYKETLSEEEYRKNIQPIANNIDPINGEDIGMVEMDTFPRKWSDNQFKLYTWMYHRLTESVDKQIGRVLRALKESGLEDNTIVIFTSDHGDMNGAHQLIHKNVMFEEAQRIPFIFSGKGIKKGTIDKSTLTCNGLDLLPTLCELANIETPKGLKGISLAPLLTGKGKRDKRDYIITESYNSFQIHDGRYKYTIYELKNNPQTLTDILRNPGETINYINDFSYRKIKDKLHNLLINELKQRKLYPLSENRSISEIRKKEKELKLMNKKHNQQ